jgi:hypothetical protein
VDFCKASLAHWEPEIISSLPTGTSRQPEKSRKGLGGTPAFESQWSGVNLNID